MHCGRRCALLFGRGDRGEEATAPFRPSTYKHAEKQADKGGERETPARHLGRDVAARAFRVWAAAEPRDARIDNGHPQLQRG